MEGSSGSEEKTMSEPADPPEECRFCELRLFGFTREDYACHLENAHDRKLGAEMWRKGALVKEEDQ